jgi:phosphate transport system substrate-binding protein
MKKAIPITIICLLALATLTACGEAASDAQSSPADEGFDPNRVIAVFTREDGSGTRDAFVSITGVGDDMYVEAVVENETNPILTKVEGNVTAISYVSVGSLNPNVKALEIDGVAPSNATIMDGSYKLQRPLLVCVNAAKMNEPLVMDFIDFMLSAEGQIHSAHRWTMADANAPAYTSSGLNGIIKVGGSTSVEPLMQRMAEAYKAANPGVEIEISGGGSGTGINESIAGIIDIGMSSRALRDNEKEELTALTIALDGVAVIVNPANPITGMTIEQVREIFTGEVTRWNQIG